jgi:hypothetical protein
VAQLLFITLHQQNVFFMKKFITLLGLLFTVLITNAQQNNRALLKIRDMEGRRIVVTINGRQFPQNGRVLTIGDVPAGNVRLKVYEYRNRGNGYANANLIYAGRLQVRGGFVYRCSIDDFEGMDVQEFCCLDRNGNYYAQGNGNNQWGDYNNFDNNWQDNTWHGQNWQNDNNGNWGNNNNNGNWNNGNNGNWGSNNNNGNGNWNNGNNNNGNWNNNNPNWNNAPSCMSNQAFEAFKQTVQGGNFDSGKLNLIKTQLSNQWINTNQLKQLVELLSFESGRIDVAKYGATRVVDRENLFLIYNSFTFESSRNEFAEYIKTLN